jgi:hypothetical protein
MVLLQAAPACSEASEDVTCRSALAHPIDPDAECYLPEGIAWELLSCASTVERGEAIECVASPAGDLFLAPRNLGAWFKSSSWRFGDQVTAEEHAVCDSVRGEGLLSPEQQCDDG